MYSPLDDAMYKTVHGYGKAKDGGAVKLAQLVGMNAGTLSNKVNPAMETHKLSVTESVAIQNTTQDYQILYAEASALGHVCVQMPDTTCVGDVALLNSYTKLHAEIGDLAQAINDALDDRQVTRKELNRISKEGTESIQAYFQLMHRLEAIIDG